MIPPWRSTIQVKSRNFFAFHLLKLSISPVYFWIEGLRQDRWDPAKKKKFLAWRDSNRGTPDPQSPMLTVRPLGIPYSFEGGILGYEKISGGGGRVLLHFYVEVFQKSL
jgi:hypothetical protein